MYRKAIILMATAGLIVSAAGCGGGSGSRGSIDNRGGILQSEEAREINRMIEEQGADWYADDNDISRLPEDTRASLSGAEVPELPVLNRMAPRNALSDAELPDSIDWRSKDDENWLSPIKNQGQCGSCVAFASVGVVESLVKISEGVPEFETDLSEADIYFCNGRNCSNNQGWYLSAAADAFRDTGVSDDACFQYQPSNLSCSRKCSDWQSRLTSIVSWNYVIADNNAIKNALLQGPVLGRMEVYNDFYYYDEGVYQRVSSDHEGGHAIAIVGYDDTGGYWIVRNSWGTSWGMDGYAYIKYGEVSIDEYVIAMQMTETPVGVTIQLDKQEATLPVSGNAQITVTCSTNGTVASTEIRCHNTRDWQSVPGGIAVCGFSATGQYTPGCRVNGSVTDEADTPFTVLEAQADSVEAAASPETGMENDPILVTCTASGGAVESYEVRCNTNQPWNNAGSDGRHYCQYRVNGTYTPGCRINGTITDDVDTAVTISGPTRPYASMSPSSGQAGDEMTLTCDYTGPAPTSIEGHCHKSWPWQRITSGNSMTCVYHNAVYRTFKPECRTNGVRTHRIAVNVAAASTKPDISFTPSSGTHDTNFTLTCGYTGTAPSTIEGHCHSSWDWQQITSGNTMSCVYNNISDRTFKPGCRFNGLVMEHIAVSVSGPATQPVASISPTSGSQDTAFTLTCDHTGPAPAKLEGRCHKLWDWQEITSGNSMACNYTVIRDRTFTPMCRTNENVTDYTIVSVTVQ